MRPSAVGEIFKGRADIVGAVAIIIMLPAILPSFSLATVVVIFAIATLGLNLLLGYAGLLSFGQGIFFGIGAYAGGLVLLHAGVGLWSAVFAGMISGAIAAAFVGWFCTRRTGIYYILLTFAFAQLFAFLVYVFKGTTGGENGLPGVPRPSVALGPIEVFGIEDPRSFYVLSGLLFLTAFCLIHRIVSSPFGSVLVAIRENEPRAVALGYNTRMVKVAAFCMSGAVTGLAGVLYVTFLYFVPDSVMQLRTSILILIMSILGGAGTLIGSLLGSLAVMLMSEVLSGLWARWEMVLGIVLIIVVFFMRGGLSAGVEQIYKWVRNRHPRIGRESRRSWRREVSRGGSDPSDSERDEALR